MSTAPESAIAKPIKVTTRSHVRGSSLLLVGRMVALLTGLVTQVLTVRYLSKNDYGAFAFALSVVTLGSSISLIGLGKAVARYVPIYHERGDQHSMFGTIVLAVGTVVGVGTLFALSVVLFRGPLSRTVVHDAQSLSLLLIVVAIVPLTALNTVLERLVAVFASARAIFFRRHIIGPLLKLLAIVLVAVTTGTVRMLAICYLLASLIGVGIYVRTVYQALKRKGVLLQFELRRLRIRAREILSYSVPMLSLDLVTILKTTMAVLLLEYFRDPTQVAEFRAVVPVAGLNLMVLQSFKFLFIPFASRLLERKDTQGISDLFWQSAIWTSIVTFPLFAVCFFLAEPVTLLMFESRYVQSADVLAILAIGSYFNAAMGLNTYALQVYARVRLTVITSVVTVVFGVILNFLLIPAYGAKGAAIATTTAVILQNVLNHLALFGTTNIRFFEWRYLGVYARIACAITILGLTRALFGPSLVVATTSVIAVSVLLLWFTRDALRLAQTFPELARVPLIAFLVGAPRQARKS